MLSAALTLSALFCAASAIPVQRRDTKAIWGQMGVPPGMTNGKSLDCWFFFFAYFLCLLFWFLFVSFEFLIISLVLSSISSPMNLSFYLFDFRVV